MLDSFIDQLDDLLRRICLKLQITDTQRKKAEERYTGVAEWLAAENSPFHWVKPAIYPQGSLKIGTTVKPRHQGEYDLDLVCEMNFDPHQENPVRILDLMEKRFKENGRYQDLVERRMNRCVRLNYADEFHMDIIPCCPDPSRKNGCVLVPDREIENWTPSNPKGYARWFQGKAWSRPILARAGIEQLPDDDPVEYKAPLKLAVQLLKRHRDIAFSENPKRGPISIVLTTLAGEIYDGQTSILDTLARTLQGIDAQITMFSPDRLKVLNPTNEDEDFSEKWDAHPKRYEAFTGWVGDTSIDVQKIERAHGRGILHVKELLEKMFGETVTKFAFKEQANELRRRREMGGLGITVGGGLTTRKLLESTPVKPHTFYGDGW